MSAVALRRYSSRYSSDRKLFCSVKWGRCPDLGAIAKGSSRNMLYFGYRTFFARLCLQGRRADIDAAFHFVIWETVITLTVFASSSPWTCSQLARMDWRMGKRARKVRVSCWWGFKRGTQKLPEADQFKENAEDHGIMHRMMKSTHWKVM